MAEPKRFELGSATFLFLVFEEEIMLNRHSVPGLTVNFSRGIYEVATLKITDVGFGQVVKGARGLVIWKEIQSFKLFKEILHGVCKEAAISFFYLEANWVSWKKGEHSGRRILGNRRVVFGFQNVPGVAVYGSGHG